MNYLDKGQENSKTIMIVSRTIDIAVCQVKKKQNNSRIHRSQNSVPSIVLPQL
jgi:hypothetical protein